MDRAENAQKFHDALLPMLYPPPSEEDKPEAVNTSSRNLNLADILDDELERPASSSDCDECEDEAEDEPKELTRAQRKRIRKKKLKQAASQQRRKIIGPLLPTTITACEGDENTVENEPQGSRQNVAEEHESLAPPEAGSKEMKSCSNEVLLKTEQAKAEENGQENG